MNIHADPPSDDNLVRMFSVRAMAISFIGEADRIMRSTTVPSIEAVKLMDDVMHCLHLYFEAVLMPGARYEFIPPHEMAREIQRLEQELAAVKAEMAHKLPRAVPPAEAVAIKHTPLKAVRSEDGIKGVPPKPDPEDKIVHAAE
jgi:hypothetical protein